MIRQLRHIIPFLVCAVLVGACVKPYEPPEIRQDYNYLVVDGVINAGPDATTTIKLTRTRRLIDSVGFDPERGAVVMIESNSGAVYNLPEKESGAYTAEHLNLDAGGMYRLKISTPTGSSYESDFVPVKTAPPVDSLSWEQNEDVSIYVSTHDPQNEARYYRWEFMETWEYRVFFESFIKFENGQLEFRDSSDLRWICWSSQASSDVLLATSAALTEDVINRFKLTTVPWASEKMDVRYSILVRQYALTEPAYQYWQLLKKNTEDIGSIFGIQPVQLTGNIRNTTNPEEPVIGFVSASLVQEKRLFIKRNELRNWRPPDYDPEASCPVLIVPTSQAPLYLQDTAQAPAYYVTGGVAISKKTCTDCLLKGGTNKKPSFW